MARTAPVALFLLGIATPARAEWTIAAYLGASFTHPSALTWRQGAASTAIPDVHFDGKPLASPPYYGYRAGWRPNARFGFEAELIHLKVYAHAADLPSSIERFSISHGLNLLLGNVTWRGSDWRRLHVEARAGAGVAIPHGESEIENVTQEQYVVSSLALQGAAAVSARLTRHLSGFGEYKLTSASPSVSVSGGQISGRFTSQHVAFGVSWTFSTTSRDVMRQRQSD